MTSHAPAVFLWHWGRAGAGAKFTLDLAAGLVRAARPPCCVCGTSESELSVRAAADPTLVARAVPALPRRGHGLAGVVTAARGALHAMGLAKAFGRALDETRPDVAVCTMQTIWDIAAIFALRKRKIRYVLVVHDAWFRVGDTYPLRAWALRRQIAASDGVMVLSDHVGAVVRKDFAYPPSRMQTIDHAAFVFGEATLVPRTLAKDRPLRLLFLGRIVAYKGLGLLLEAYGALRARGIRVTLDIAGDGDIAAQRTAISMLPEVLLQNHWLDDGDIAFALQRCDVVVLPYIEATQSGIAAAAFAAALPVVATPVGGLVDQIADGRTGLFAANVSADALADAIAGLCADHELYARLSEGALSHAQNDLSWDGAAAKTVAFLDSIVALPPRHQSRRGDKSRGSRARLFHGGLT